MRAVEARIVVQILLNSFVSKPSRFEGQGFQALMLSLKRCHLPLHDLGSPHPTHGNHALQRY